MKALPACSQSLLQLPVVHVVKHVVVCRVGSISLHHAKTNKNTEHDSVSVGAKEIVITPPAARVRTRKNA